jgi:hypothetical protein
MKNSFDFFGDLPNRHLEGIRDRQLLTGLNFEKNPVSSPRTAAA